MYDLALVAPATPAVPPLKRPAKAAAIRIIEQRGGIRSAEIGSQGEFFAYLFYDGLVGIALRFEPALQAAYALVGIAPATAGLASCEVRTPHFPFPVSMGWPGKRAWRNRSSTAGLL